MNSKWEFNGKWGRYSVPVWFLLFVGSLRLWPLLADWIEMTFYSIAVVGIFLTQVLRYKRRKRFWWALGVPLVGHIFFLDKIKNIFPLRYVLLIFPLIAGASGALLFVMALLFGVTRTNPLVPDASLPETIKQNENGTP
jgi:hypothetical protein